MVQIWQASAKRVGLFGAVVLLTACGGDAHDGSISAGSSYAVGGQLSGLGAGKSVVIADASGPSVSLSANGAYRLSLAPGTEYNLRIQTQPIGQTCSVANGRGTAQPDLSSVSVTCQDNPAVPGAAPVAGAVTGLDSGSTLLLQLESGGVVQEARVSAADGSFTFAQPVRGAYSVRVRSQPVGQTCTVVNAQGTVAAGGSLPALAVNCATNGYKLSGIVSGLVSGSGDAVSLLNNVSGETLHLNSNGTFTFAQPVLAGTSYNVVVADSGGGQTCSVANGSGAAWADVTNLDVNCLADVPVVRPPVVVPPVVEPPVIEPPVVEPPVVEPPVVEPPVVDPPVVEPPVVEPPVVVPPVVVPYTPTGLALAYSAKTFQLSWTAVAPPTGGGDVTYRVWEDIDGPGPAASAQIVADLAVTSFNVEVTGLLHKRLDANYSVEACNTAGCSTAATAVTVDLAKATGYFKASNSGAGDSFGNTVELSGDGSTLAVGAYGEDSNATGINGSQQNDAATDSGAVYVFTRSAGQWVQQAYVKASNTGAGDRFGTSITLSSDGNTLAVGASGEASKATGINSPTLEGDNTLASSGAVYVFSRSGVTWTQQAYVKASNTGMNDKFGVSTALSSDGNTLAVGASGEASKATGINSPTLQGDNTSASSGAVYVFARSGVAWTQQAYVKASNTGATDFFGYSTVLSGDGSTLAVGAYGEDSKAVGINSLTLQSDNAVGSSGAVYVFTRSGVAWTQQAYVKASNTGASDFFGYSTALSNDGNTLAVGAYGEDSNATSIGGSQTSNTALNAGAVYVFSRSGVAWSQQAYVKASNASAYDRFGYSVALSGDGGTLAVGASLEDSNATGINGDQSNNTALTAGAVYIFSGSGTAWAQQAYVKASNTAADQPTFGTAAAEEEVSGVFGIGLALSSDGDTLAVGAYHEDSNATGIGGNQANGSAEHAGAVYVY